MASYAGLAMAAGLRLLPSMVLKSDVLQSAAQTGNTAVVLQALASHYGLPKWATCTLSVLVESVGPPARGLATMFSRSGVSARLAELLETCDAAAELAQLNLTASYSEAVAAADIGSLVRLVGVKFQIVYLIKKYLRMNL